MSDRTPDGSHGLPNGDVGWELETELDGRLVRVLLVDDDVAFAHDVSAGLTEIGCRVEVLRDGASGLARAVSDRFDLVIASVEIGGINGFRLCSRMKKDPNRAATPFFLLSEDAEELDHHAALATKADAYFKKPVMVRELVARVRAHLPALSGALGDGTATSARGRTLPPDGQQRDGSAFAIVRRRLAEHQETIQRLMRDLADARAAAQAPPAPSPDAEGAVGARKRGPPPLPTREGAALREQLAKKDSDIDAQKREIQGQKQSLLEARESLRALTQKHADLGRQLEETARTADQQRKAREAERCDRDEATSRADNAERAVAELRTELAAGQDALGAEKSGRENDRALHERALEEQKASFEHDRARAEEQRVAERAEKEAAEAAQRTRVRDDLERKIAEQKRRIEELEALQWQAGDDVREREAKLAQDHEAALSSLRAEHVEAHANLERANKALDQALAQREGNRRDLDEAVARARTEAASAQQALEDERRTRAQETLELSRRLETATTERQRDREQAETRLAQLREAYKKQADAERASGEGERSSVAARHEAERSRLAAELEAATGDLAAERARAAGDLERARADAERALLAAKAEEAAQATRRFETELDKLRAEQSRTARAAEERLQAEQEEHAHRITDLARRTDEMERSLASEKHARAADEAAHARAMTEVLAGKDEELAGRLQGLRAQDDAARDEERRAHALELASLREDNQRNIEALRESERARREGELAREKAEQAQALTATEDAWAAEKAELCRQRDAAVAELGNSADERLGAETRALEARIQEQGERAARELASREAMADEALLALRVEREARAEDAAAHLRAIEELHTAQGHARAETEARLLEEKANLAAEHGSHDAQIAALRASSDASLSAAEHRARTLDDELRKARAAHAAELEKLRSAGEQGDAQSQEPLRGEVEQLRRALERAVRDQKQLEHEIERLRDQTEADRRAAEEHEARAVADAESAARAPVVAALAERARIEKEHALRIAEVRAKNAADLEDRMARLAAEHATRQHEIVGDQRIHYEKEITTREARWHRERDDLLVRLDQAALDQTALETRVELDIAALRSELEAERSARAADVEEKTSHLAGSAELLVAHEQDNVRLSNDLSDAHAEIAELEAEIAVLRNELTTMRMELDDHAIVARSASEQMERDRGLLEQTKEALRSALDRLVEASLPPKTS